MLQTFYSPFWTFIEYRSSKDRREKLYGWIIFTSLHINIASSVIIGCHHTWLTYNIGQMACIMQLEDVVAGHDVWRQVVAMASQDIHVLILDFVAGVVFVVVGCGCYSYSVVFT